MNRFSAKIGRLDIFGIIYILELLKCLDFFEVEANNMLQLYFTTAPNNISGILYLKTVVKSRRFIIFWY